MSKHGTRTKFIYIYIYIYIINNKITNIYEFKGDYIEGNNDRLKIKLVNKKNKLDMNMNLKKENSPTLEALKH